MLGIRYFANMVGHRENSANWVGLPDSAMGLMKEMTVVTNSEMGVDFSTYYIVEHDMVEAEKKKSGLKTYLIALVAIGDAG